MNLKITKILATFSILLLILLGGLYYVYSTAMVVKQDCKGEHLYRYHFGIYRIYTQINDKKVYQPVYGWRHFLGLEPIACYEQIEYNQCVKTEKANQLQAEKDNKQWTQVRDNLYINAKQQLALKFPYANRCSMFSSEHVQVDQSLPLRNDRFYLHLGFGGEEELSLNDTIDLKTFRQLPQSNFYKDKNHVYRYFDMLDGGNFGIFEADPQSFEIIDACYAKDKNHIYEERSGKLEGVDYTSFKPMTGAGCIALDKNGYWFWGDHKESKDLSAEEREMIKALN